MFGAADRREADTSKRRRCAPARRRDATRIASERHKAPAHPNLRPPRNTRQADQLAPGSHGRSPPPPGFHASERCGVGRPHGPTRCAFRLKAHSHRPASALLLTSPSPRAAGAVEGRCDAPCTRPLSCRSWDGQASSPGPLGHFRHRHATAASSRRASRCAQGASSPPVIRHRHAAWRSTSSGAFFAPELSTYRAGRANGRCVRTARTKSSHCALATPASPLEASSPFTPRTGERRRRDRPPRPKRQSEPRCGAGRCWRR
jgi:hypothetical protein